MRIQFENATRLPYIAERASSGYMIATSVSLVFGNRPPRIAKDLALESQAHPVP